jgi:O-antigen/teichoic acid export membrane protein
MRLLRAIAWTGLGQLALLVSGVISAALINRAISPSGRGIVAEAQTWTALMVVLLGFSLASAIYHFANRGQVSNAARVFVTLVMSSMVSLLATAGLAAVLFGPGALTSAATYEAWPTLIGLPAASIYCANLQALAVALGRTKLSAAANLLMATLSIVLLLAAYTADFLDIEYALFVMFVVQAVGALYLFIGIWRRVGLVSDGISVAILRRFLAIGLKQHAGTVSMFVYTRVNPLIVFHYCGDRETGLLAAAHALAFGLFSLFGAAQTALYSHVSRESDDGLQITIAMLRVVFYSGLLLMLPTMIGAEWLMRAYGGTQFADAAWSFRMLLCAAWLLTVAGMAAPYYVKASAFAFVSTISVVAAIVGIALNLFLVPRFGANGASAATLLTVALVFLGVLAMIRAVSGVWPSQAFVPQFTAERARIAEWWQSVRL